MIHLKIDNLNENLNTVIAYAALIVPNEIWWCCVTNHNWVMMVRLGRYSHKNIGTRIVTYFTAIQFIRVIFHPLQ